MSIEVILAGKGHDVVTIAPASTMREAADTLHRHRIGAVVVTGVDGVLIGILVRARYRFGPCARRWQRARQSRVATHDARGRHGA